MLFRSETADSFEGNALLKARALAYFTGLPAIADDSGLCVDALDGAPGVLSARWSGPPKSDDRNNSLLLAQLAENGRLIMPVGGEGGQELMRFTRRDQKIEKTSLGPVSFVPLQPGVVAG